MNRNHLIYTFYILVTAFLVGVGVMAYEACVYRMQKTSMVRATESAGYAATIQYKKAQSDNISLDDIRDDFYDCLSLIRGEREEVLYEEYPIFVVIQNTGYTLYAFGKSRGFTLFDDGEWFTLDDANAATRATPMIVDSVNLAIGELNMMYRTELPYLFLEKGITLDMSESLVVVYVAPYNRFNNSTYASLYQSSGQIKER